MNRKQKLVPQVLTEYRDMLVKTGIDKDAQLTTDDSNKPVVLFFDEDNGELCLVYEEDAAEFMNLMMQC